MQLSASEVLHTFHRDEISLFLGATFATVGLISFGFLLVRRRFDALLFWLGLFALLYGGRLWMQAQLMSLMVPPSEWFDRLKAATNFLVAIPGFFFFQATRFLGRLSDYIAYISAFVLSVLLLATFFGAPLNALYLVNNIVVIAALFLLLFQSFLTASPGKELVVARNGLLAFVAFALWNNIGNLFGLYPDTEKYGFAIFLACLGYVAARRAQERDQQLNEIQKELEIATRIQLPILPGEYPPSRYFRVAARYVPMRSVAGDFYDFVVAGEKQTGLLIADVSGHGVPAALIASMVKVAASSHKESASDPPQFLSAINTTLCGNTQNQFVTAAFVHLDAERRELRYAAAGHPPMLLLRDGQIRQIEENGLILALFPAATYASATLPLQHRDRIVLYTDGVIEATDRNAEQFGQERLAALLQETLASSHRTAADHIITAVQNWAVAQEDDLTVIVCDYVEQI
jgi:sigma-B regulation protein RsbU (phosphoserine phosphatase)